MSTPHNTKLDHSAQNAEIWRERVCVRACGKGVYILFSLEAFPPEIFCTRNWPSSVFSSRSCFWRSSFDLPHNWTVLILVVFDCHPPPPSQPMRFLNPESHSFYHLVRELYADLHKSSGAVVTCDLARRAQNILDCAALPTLMVVKR